MLPFSFLINFSLSTHFCFQSQAPKQIKLLTSPLFVCACYCSFLSHHITFFVRSRSYNVVLESTLLYMW